MRGFAAIALKALKAIAKAVLAMWLFALCGMLGDIDGFERARSLLDRDRNC